MKVVITQTGDGIVQQLEFQVEAETPAQFKTAIRTWLTANYPAMTISDIFARIVQIAPHVVILNMT